MSETEVFFNADDAPPPSDFDPIPPGWYTMIMTESEMKDTKLKDGQTEPGRRLACTFEVVDGPHAGRKIFEGFNWKNANAEAVKISMAQFGALTRSCGKVAIGAPGELHNIPFQGQVKVTPARDGYEPGNKVTKYKPVGEAVEAAAAAPASPAPAGEAKPKSAPWGGKKAG